MRARNLIDLYPQKRSALIPALHILQEQDGYLSPDGIEHLAELVELTPAEVRGTASFYDMFHLEPIGRYLVAVCTNIACMLAGAYELLEHIEDRLGVSPGGTTPDRSFTLEDAECLALCGNAPCLTVNWRYFGDMTPALWDKLAADLVAGRLAAEVPPHGTLCRVRRSVALPATTIGTTIMARPLARLLARPLVRLLGRVLMEDRRRRPHPPGPASGLVGKPPPPWPAPQRAKAVKSSSSLRPGRLAPW